MKTYVVSEKLQEALGTFEEAIDQVLIDARSQKLAPGEPVRIVIDGVLHLKNTVTISASQLPGADHPVFIEGADADSGFSGGKEIKGFTHWKDNIWRVSIPDVEYTRHLYIDGKIAKRPATECRKPFRWDVLEAEDYVLFDKEGKNNSESNTDICNGIATTHTEIAGWRNARDLEMVFEVGWVHRVVPIEYVEQLPDGRLFIKPMEPAFHSARNVEGVQIGGCPSYIENVFELLGKPLEWYFDRKEKMLYVGFAEGDKPENHTVVVPLVEQLINVKGALENQPCHLNFSNLNFMHTTWLFPQKYGFPEVQANQIKFTSIPEELKLEKPYEADHQKVIAALRIVSARDVSFKNCTFTALGTGALQYEFGAQECKIEGNHFYEIGGSAVSMGDFYLERAHHPKDRREIVRNIEIKNNNIHHTGRDFRGSVAIIGGYVQDITIAHNEIHEVPYTAISIGWGWGEADVSVGPKLKTRWKEPSVCMRNRIVNNHIYRCMMALCDGGAIYTLGSMPGTVISGNYIHESSGYKGDGFEKLYILGYKVEEVHDKAGDIFWDRHGVPGGIYLDEGSRGIEVCNNVMHDIAVPMFYHNQIDMGYTMVSWTDNVINKRPADEGFPKEIVSCAGIEHSYNKTF